MDVLVVVRVGDVSDALWLDRRRNWPITMNPFLPRGEVLGVNLPLEDFDDDR